MNKRTRNVCFTGFNETGYEFNEKQMKYLVVGKEICPTTGKEHWQGYVELKNAKTFSAIKKLFKDNKLHLEERKGNALQASNYCKKDGKYIEFGELSSQGARSDLVALKDDILAGKKNAQKSGKRIQNYITNMDVRWTSWKTIIYANKNEIG